MASQPSTPGGVSTLGSSEPGSARKGGKASRSQSLHQLREPPLLSSTSSGGGGGGHNPFGAAERPQLTADSHVTFNCMLCKLSLPMALMDSSKVGKCCQDVRSYKALSDRGMRVRALKTWWNGLDENRRVEWFRKQQSLKHGEKTQFRDDLHRRRYPVCLVEPRQHRSLDPMEKI